MVSLLRPSKPRISLSRWYSHVRLPYRSRRNRDARSVNGRDLLGACAGCVGPLAGLDSLSIGYGQCRIDFTVETSSDRSIGRPSPRGRLCIIPSRPLPTAAPAGRHDHAPGHVVGDQTPGSQGPAPGAVIPRHVAGAPCPDELEHHRTAQDCGAGDPHRMGRTPHSAIRCARLTARRRRIPPSSCPQRAGRSNPTTVRTCSFCSLGDAFWRVGHEVAGDSF